MHALRELRSELRLSVLAFVWGASLAGTLLLVATNAPTAVVALVFGAIGAVIVTTVPRVSLWHMSARSEPSVVATADAKADREPLSSDPSEQRLAALDRANAIRLARAELKHRIATNRIAADDAADLAVRLAPTSRPGTIELRSLSGRLAAALVRSAARQLPSKERSRWQEEWLGELYDMRDRHALVLTWGIGVRLTAKALAAELRGELGREQIGDAGQRLDAGGTNVSSTTTESGH